jgi:hypothetical protein
MQCASGERLAAALRSRRPALWNTNPRLTERIEMRDRRWPRGHHELSPCLVWTGHYRERRGAVRLDVGPGATADERGAQDRLAACVRADYPEGERQAA